MSKTFLYRFTLIAFGCFLSINSWGIYLVWADYPDGRLYRIDIEKKLLQQEKAIGQWQDIAEIIFTGINITDFPTNARVISIEIPDKKTERYLLIDCTNQVYHFDFKNLSLKRLDNTFFRGYNCLSTRFLRKDSLYSFGGYGFWQTNNIQTYFKKASAEWESLYPENPAPVAINHGLNAYIANQDYFFSAYNSLHRDSKNHGRSEYEKEAFQYSFSKKEWITLGKVTHPKISELLIPNDKTPIIWTGKYFLLEYKEDAMLKLLLINPVENRVLLWQDHQKILGSQIAKTIEEDPFSMYSWHDTLYFLNESNFAKMANVRHKIAINTLEKESIADGKLYGNFHGFWIFVFVSMLVLLISFGMWKKRKTVNFSTTQPIDKNISSFTEQEKIVLKVLKEHFTTTGVDSNLMNELLVIEDKLPENQRKIRNEFIKQFNQKLITLYHVKEAIIRTPSVDDKRFYYYQLSEEVFNKIPY
ncbi:hypothetical protein VB264_09505 [Arcicella aquatica]|uniref:DUF4350 domain-containing protein n=1 Tax=Arcicella aquatica TaxID=217141 RepID=A0ABU5QMU1_9BACT|nr:hypothetical protein [Arcicella aquatica]MEA5258019.1 hypothetical protein [Arcicella aquatica]